MDPLNVIAKFEIRSFSRSWDNGGYPKKLGSPGYAHAPYSQKNFNGLLFRWTL